MADELLANPLQVDVLEELYLAGHQIPSIPAQVLLGNMPSLVRLNIIGGDINKKICLDLSTGEVCPRLRFIRLGVDMTVVATVLDMIESRQDRAKSSVHLNRGITPFEVAHITTWGGCHIWDCVQRASRIAEKKDVKIFMYLDE